MGNEINTNKVSFTKPFIISNSKAPNTSNKVTNLNTKLNEINFKKSNNLNAQKKLTFSEKVESIFKNGLEYLKGVRDQAAKDRQAGVKTMEGALSYWDKISSAADEIGRKAQDYVLEDFTKEVSNTVIKELEGTKLGKELEELFGLKTEAANAATTGTKATAGAAAEATVAAESKIGASVATTAAKESSEGILSGIASKAGSIVGGIGAAYSLYSLYRDFGKTTPLVSGMQGATIGAYAGSIFPGVGTVIGGVVGFAAGAVLGLFNTKKHPEHIARDNMRTALQSAGFLDKDQNITLADGSKYSFATDGKKTLTGLDNATRFGYQVDFANPLSSQAIGWMQPLAEVMTQGNQKLKTDLLGYMVNAATSNAKSEEDVRANVISIYQQSKLNPEDVIAGLSELLQNGKIKEDNIPAYLNGIQTLVSDASSDAVDQAA